nr:hypothetical protein [Tanacetum cinerariifolium]
MYLSCLLKEQHWELALYLKVHCCGFDFQELSLSSDSHTAQSVCHSLFFREVSTFLFLVFDGFPRLLFVDVDSNRGEGGLTISLSLLMVIACDLVDVVCLDDGAWVLYGFGS